VLAVSCVVFLVALELSFLFMMRNYSSTYARVSQQYAEAAQAGPSRPGEPTSVLLLGNSLLLDGVDEQRLQQLTSGSLRIYPIFLEGTGYHDWLYGLRRLFRQGARPEVVVVGLEVNTAFENSVREEYGPMLLFDARDVLELASDLGLSRTEASNLLLAHYSAFWNTRSVFRRRVLRRMVPHFEDLFPVIQRSKTVPDGLELESLAIPRLRALRELCAAHGARLVLLVPPTPSSQGAVQGIAEAARKAGVAALVPIDPTALAMTYYKPDAIHLNSGGAAVFTEALATDLSKTIGNGGIPTARD
jgi:hypothetical protein